MNAKYYKDELNVYACFIEQRTRQRTRRKTRRIQRAREREKKSELVNEIKVYNMFL